MEFIFYEHTPGSYGQIRYHPLILANETNTQLEEWFHTYKYLHFLLSKDVEKEFVEYRLPIEFEYSLRTRTRNFDGLKEDSNLLVDRSMFQELFRILVATLESANEMIEITKHKKVGSSVEEFKSHIQAKVRSFHKKPFPKKIEKFEVEENFSEFLDALNSVNKARNCLEHRNGILGKEDCNDGDKLVINYRYPAPIGKDGKPLDIFDRMPIGPSYPVDFVERKGKYRRGEKLTIGFKDSYKLIYSINFALKGIVDAIYKLCGFTENIWVIKQFKC